VRLIVAIVLLAVSSIALSIGIAQRTVFDAPDTITLGITTETGTPATIIHGTELQKYPGRYTLTVEGGSGVEQNSTDQIFVAYGRTVDVMAWLSPARHTTLRIDQVGMEMLALPRAGEPYLPDPVGSDLWLAEYTGTGSLSVSVAAPETVTILIMSDGQLPAPPRVSVSWPVVNEAPWILALLIVGILTMVAGFLSLIIAWAHWRKTRGPRRLKTRRPRTRAPRVPRVKRPSSLRPRGRRLAQFVAIPVVGLLGLGACAPNAPSPTPVGQESQSQVAQSEVAAPYPVVTEVQFSKIMSRVADQIQRADEELSPNTLAPRVEEPTLSARRAAYVIKRADPESVAILPIPASPIRLVLPQQTTTWPRTVFGIIQDEADLNSPSLAVVLKQNDPRSQYELSYAVALNQQVQLPNVPGASVGSPKLSADSKLTKITPNEVVTFYADVLRRGTASPYAGEFALANDPLFQQAGPGAEALRQESFGEAVTVTWESRPGDTELVVLASADAGAIVMGTIREIEFITPVQSGAAVNSSIAIRALTSLSQSTRGFEVESQIQILWYVPKVGSNEPIRVLGFTHSLVGAKEVERE